MRTDASCRRALAGAALVVSLLASGNADAFCRTTTTPPPVDYDTSTSGCWAEGIPLFHRSQCLPYHLLAKESAVIPNAVLSAKLATALATWTAGNAHCVPGISGIELAPSNASAIVGYTVGGGNENLVGVPADWHYSSEMLVVPTVHFNATTGEIYDVDVEINPNVAWAFNDPIPTAGYDLEAALAHAAGHMLGIADSTVPEATMFGRYNPGDTSQRSLDDDDEQAICSIYVNRSERAVLEGTVPSTACNLAPGSAACDADIAHGCSTSPTEAASSRAGGLLAALLAVLGVTRARRLRRA